MTLTNNAAAHASALAQRFRTRRSLRALVGFGVLAWLILLVGLSTQGCGNGDSQTNDARADAALDDSGILDASVSSDAADASNGCDPSEICVLLYEGIEEEMLNDDVLFNNPFTETELLLTVQAPIGRPLGGSFVWYGFHDGDGNGGQSGNIWKFRLVFDHPGIWTINAAFVEPGTSTPNGPSRDFTYHVLETAATGQHGHVYVDSDNPLRFRHADGTPWVPIVMHSSMLLDRDFTVARQWIDEHASLHVDALAVRFHTEAWILGTDSGKWHYLIDSDRAAAWPGDPNDPWDYSGTDDFDYTRFDVASWQHNEQVIEYAQSKGIKLSIWFGISGLNRQYWSYGPLDYPDDATIGPQQALFIKYFLARWAPYTSWWNWAIDSEYEETGQGAAERVRAYAAYMRSLNPWRTLLTTHIVSDWTLGEAPEMDLVTLQLRVADTDDGVTDCRSFITENSGYHRPIFNAEGIWMLASSTRSRIAMWTHLMAGGFAKIAHDGPDHTQSSWGVTWDHVDPRHREDAVEVGRLSAFFNQTPGIDISRLVPHSELVSVSGGHLAMCLAEPGERYYIWLDRGGTLTVDISDVSGTFSVVRYRGSDLANQVELPDVQGGEELTLDSTPETGHGADYLFVIENLGI